MAVMPRASCVAPAGAHLTTTDQGSRGGGRRDQNHKTSAAVRGSTPIAFAWRAFPGEQIGHQPCENSMENTALNLDFCASRCSLLQCGSESYRCPPWAFPP